MTTAWPKNAVAMAAPHLLSEFGACVACGHPVHTTGIDSAVHTTTGLYTCSEWPHGQAELDSAASEDERHEEIAKECELAVENATESIKDDIGYDISRWLETLERKYTGDDDNVPQLAEEIIEAMRDWVSENL